MNMIYKETLLGVAVDAQGLSYILNTYVSKDATIIVASSGETQPDVEVWHDKDTNTIILK
jgi:hypothetical protein